MTTGWWFGANPYAGQMNYLDYVVPSTRAVTSPTITPEGVVQSDAGSSAGPPAADGGTLTVGQASQASTQGGLISPSSLSKGNEIGQLALAFAGVPTVATSLAGLNFAAANYAGGKLAGLNIDPTTGLAVGSSAFKGLMADPMFASLIDFSAPSISPLSAATVGPLGANQAGFATSPFATGTPFSANPPGIPSQSNFGRGMDSAPPPAPTADPTPDPTTDTGITTGDEGSPTGDAGDSGWKRGGLIPNAHPGTGDDEPIKAQGGEFVVRRSAAAKYRTLLEQINRGAHPNVVAHHASKLAQRVAR